jgi:hypothetical protein
VSEETRLERREEWSSKAIVACDGHGRGAVLWYVGGALENEIGECRLRELGDLGLDDAPQGISVWEGTYIWVSGPFECPDDGRMDPSGKFRSPTDEEWRAVREGRCPWPHEKAGSK